jgi:hypothetical protein
MYGVHGAAVSEDAPRRSAFGVAPVNPTAVLGQSQNFAPKSRQAWHCLKAPPPGSAPTGRFLANTGTSIQRREKIDRKVKVIPSP